MRTGVAYHAPHNPKHIRVDLEDIRGLGCDDVLLAFQENDFVYLTGKLEFTPDIARDVGLRPIAIFWGGLNFFGGGRSSQFLLAHPEAHQVQKDGSWHEGGCYNHAISRARILEIVGHVANLGFEGFFVDEPSPTDCYCDACRTLFAQWYGENLCTAGAEVTSTFRRRSVIHYVETLTGFLREHHPEIETMCCMMPSDQKCWEEVASIPALDALGTDVYWANTAHDLDHMRPIVRSMAELCQRHGKIHQEWFQCWGIDAGNESRAAEQGRILIEEQPDALYTWAYNGQLGTSEACDRPDVAWALAAEVLRDAKG